MPEFSPDTGSIPGTSPASTAADEQLLERLRVATRGEYDIYGELGRGGMATVFLAHEISLARKVAIKVMSPAMLHGHGMAERPTSPIPTSFRSMRCGRRKASCSS
jgi:serine/threonine protein kinase